LEAAAKQNPSPHHRFRSFTLTDLTRPIVEGSGMPGKIAVAKLETH
jgi:hypothetical protein